MTWQGSLETYDRTHYSGESDTQSWAVHGMEMNKQGYYPTYPDQTSEIPNYYTDHTHALSGDVTSCHQSTYADTQMVPMTTMPSPHGMHDVHQHYPSGPAAEMEQWHLQMFSQADPSFLSIPLKDGPRKRKRRRMISHGQRKAANIRERRRMYQLNDAFDGLRKRVPTFAYEKKLSRIDTLKLAVTYIEFMAGILENNGEKCTELVNKEKSKKSDKNGLLASEGESQSVMDNDVISMSHSSSQSTEENDSSDDNGNDDSKVE